MISVRLGGAVDPFEQIRMQIADQIRSGELPAGTRLPAIRQLASDLRVAPGTVAKAYAMLEADGLVESSRAKGTRVAAGQTHAVGIQEAARQFAAAVGDVDVETALSAVRAAWAAR